QVAQQVARSEKDALIAELGAAGVRHDPKGIVTIFRDADGRIVWLERGNSRAGLQHVLSHAADFASKGVTEERIPSLLQRAIQDGRIIGYQGDGEGRPIYAVAFQGHELKVGITVSDNGFIVGANPVS
ncbi:MAG TPA: hypothetical protein VH085_10525, partial [Nocardioides sp.]|nr:hypothetical protein [Nocardioides sp.]